MVVTTPPVLASALANLADHAVKTRLCPDTHIMQFDRRDLPEWLACHLEDCRPAYTEALRHEAGLCIRCGDDDAKHPSKNPKFPPLFCGSCFARGAWENWSWGVPLKGGPKANADSAKQREIDAAMFDGIEDDDEPIFSESDSLFDGPADGTGTGRSGGASSFLRLLRE